MKQRIIPALVLVLIWFISTTPWADIGSSVDLSPASWPPGEIEKYTELDYNWERPHPRGKGIRGMIVDAASSTAVRAGLEALKQGGTAADAAIVTAMTEIVFMAGCSASFGGVLYSLYYDANSGKVYSLDAGWNTLMREKDPLSIPPLGTASGRSALVPGFMAGIEALHQSFGRLSWASLFEPAIFFAEEGFRVNPWLSRKIDLSIDVLTRLPKTRMIFTSEDGDLYQVGEIFKQPQLAHTLQRWARIGAQDAYQGTWARRLRRAVRAEGGKMTLTDLKKYKVIWSEPVRTRYRDTEVFLIGEPALGGVAMKATLERLGNYDLAALGHYTESPGAFYHIAQTIRELWLDDGFSSGKAVSHSDAVIAIDEEGNIAVVLHSINTNMWGTTGIFVDGVSISDAASFMQKEVQDAGPGARLPLSANPALVLDNGRPILATNEIGSGLVAATSQALINMIDYSMGPKQAQGTPYIRHPDFTKPDYPMQVTLGDFPPWLLNYVRSLRVPIVEQEPWSGSGYGFWVGIMITPEGRIIGATDETFGGYALGY